jgi:hypothetical protein
MEMVYLQIVCSVLHLSSSVLLYCLALSYLLFSGMLPLMEMVCYLCHAIRCLVVT